IGWASSGVEYAQAYRANLLRRAGADCKFIFTDMFRMENIEHMTENIGFRDDEIIWLYSYFTDFRIAPTTYTIGQLLKTFPTEKWRIQKEKKMIRYYFDELGVYANAYLRSEDGEFVQRVEYVSRGKLIRKDYFTYGRLFSEYYSPVNNEAHLYMRRFYNEDGTEALVEIIDGETNVYKIGNRTIFSKQRFIAYFLSCLQFKEGDILIIDRATEIGQAVLHEHGKAKIGSVVHAEHYSENNVTEHTILWNNYYEFEFTHADRLDFFITSTDAQNRILAEQMKKYQGMTPRIVTIPVGSIDTLKRPASERKRHSLITASRLASEKHIDWLISAVAKARESVPDISLDIYGSGGEETKLKAMITLLKAEGYVRLMGHHPLEDIYQKYEAYAAGSTSEGFGLTLLEAVGSGLPIIGFDVHYGNQTFISHEENGYLIPYDKTLSTEEKVERLAKAMVRLFTEADVQAFSEKSYEIAEDYLTDRVVDRWRGLIREMQAGAGMEEKR
ncbi:MAG: accessory Sec system glycosyltransferase GtfA, partial [Lachnospiraceae bacterium]|nr:accessory Sec system glycosyltransferase GtfA [Lachnospiraceae bacterium]